MNRHHVVDFRNPPTCAGPLHEPSGTGPEGQFGRVTNPTSGLRHCGQAGHTEISSVSTKQLEEAHVDPEVEGRMREVQLHRLVHSPRLRRTPLMEHCLATVTADPRAAVCLGQALIAVQVSLAATLSSSVAVPMICTERFDATLAN